MRAIEPAPKPISPKMGDIITVDMDSLGKYCGMVLDPSGPDWGKMFILAIMRPNRTHDSYHVATVVTFINAKVTIWPNPTIELESKER